MTLPQLDVSAFAAFPAGLAAALRPRAVQAVDELLGDTAEEWRPGVGPLTVVAALDHFCDLVEDTGPATWERIAEEYAALGRRLARDQRALEQLNQLLLRSARALWHLLDGLAGTDPAMLRRVSEAHLGFLDAVTAAVAQGCRSRLPDEDERRDRLRGELLALLLAGPPADPASLSAIAEQAGWPLPRRVAAAVLHPRPGRDRRPLMVPQGVLADLTGDRPCLLVPDPGGPGRMRLLRPLLADWIVAVGPAVPVDGAAASLRWARETLALAERGVIPSDDVVSGTDHMATLVIFQAEELIDHSAAARLAPLRDIAPGHRERLMETLLALLECRFTASEAAGMLQVHPQTVRYRLRQLEELFGDDLQDPRICLELEMILHARLAGSRERRPAGRRAIAAHG
ncbi:PucR family transcriptional regulator [Actinomadura macrotermitis]|uniref:PucR family transcriptional regulator n=1 Tax=Actinomadura macrotermitis TaxID=2585200 RepID=A0A7K0C8S8_9ACTN|nr:helix-turn-helix domain-containing protein [Actinomadura macrotermitis]MQY09512.1 hypothetical protein [Actinomadura macrotermitis]